MIREKHRRSPRGLSASDEPAQDPDQLLQTDGTRVAALSSIPGGSTRSRADRTHVRHRWRNEEDNYLMGGQEQRRITHRIRAAKTTESMGLRFSRTRR